MTEDEAKTKWCPFVRAASPDGAAAWNRSSFITYEHEARQATRCIASACMAWRWSEKQPPGHGFFADGSPHPEGALGFCGLAGAPR